MQFQTHFKFLPDPPLPTPESPSSARASDVSDPIQVSDDSTAPDPEVTTPASVEEISESPYHPDPKLIPPKKTATQNIYFQRKWFGEYPWLSYNSTIGGVICHQCYTANRLGMMNIATKSDEAFIKVGFSNWKKATQRFNSHGLSQSQIHAVSSLKAQQNKSISVQLCSGEEDKQKERRRWLCRFKPIKATVDNYKALISGMEKIVENKLLSTTTGQSKAQGILSSLRKPQTFLGLCAIIKPLALLEQLSLTLQGEEVDIDSTEQAIRTVEETITKYRDSEFEASLQEMNDLITGYC